MVYHQHRLPALDAVEDVGAQHQPSRRVAVVDRPSLLLVLSQQLPGPHRARLQVEGRGHPVHGLETESRWCLSVTVQVYEPGTEHQTGHIQHLVSLSLAGPDKGDLASGHANVPDLIETGLRVDHPGADEQGVEDLGHLRPTT